MRVDSRDLWQQPTSNLHVYNTMLQIAMNASGSQRFVAAANQQPAKTRLGHTSAVVTKVIDLPLMENVQVGSHGSW